MPVRIDHVIIACDDLSVAEAAFARLGFFVTGGGTHPLLGTRNRVIVLGEGYLELVAVADPSAASPALRGRIAQRAGYVGYAAQSDGIEHEVAAMRARGVDVRGPRAGRLVALDGTVRGWRTALVGGDDLWSVAEPLPFLIQHDASGEEHRRQLGGAGGLAPHPNGATGILGVAVATDDLAVLRARYAQVYGLASEAAPPHRDDELGAEVVTLPLDGGAERVLLAQPTGASRAAERLAVAGPGLCQATIAIASRDEAARWLVDHDVVAETTPDGDLAVRVPGTQCGWIVLRETVEAAQQ